MPYNVLHESLAAEAARLAKKHGAAQAIVILLKQSDDDEETDDVLVGLTAGTDEDRRAMLGRAHVAVETDAGVGEAERRSSPDRI